MKLDDYIAKLERLSILADSVSIISLIDNLKEIKKSQKVADYKSAVDIFFNVAKLIEKDYILFSKKF